MAISANTLFHFTDFKSLCNILRSGTFLPKYSKESFVNIFEERSPFEYCHIPMVSFCDLTLIQLCINSPHCENFGKYGIGLTKEWGIRNSISPITYVHQNSQHVKFIEGYRELFNSLYEKEGIDTARAERSIIDSLKLVKPYKGKFHRGNDNSEEIIYYNEREWRYCPQDYTVLDKNTTKGIIGEYNEQLKNTGLEFSTKDIKFVVLDTIGCSKKVKGDKKLFSIFKKLEPKTIIIDALKEDY